VSDFGNIDITAYQLTTADLLTVFSTIEKTVLSHRKQQKTPFITIIGGQPGSGKSSLCEQLRQQYAKNDVVFIDIDQLRKYHPKNKWLFKQNDKMAALYTGTDAGKWTAMLLQRAAENKCNIAYESTLKNTPSNLFMIEELNKAGYDVSLLLMVVKPEITQVSTYVRYERMKETYGYGRYVIPHYHDDSFNNISQALQAIKEQGLVSKIELYTREQPLFQGDYRKEDVVAIVNAEYKRPLTPEETKYIRDSWDEVRQLMFKRGCPMNEMNDIDNLSRPYQLPAATTSPE
jgi:UDP-N-acetylglucosamine kinase